MDDTAREVITRNTDAVLLQAATNERTNALLDRLDARLAVPPPQAALSRGSVALLVLLVTLGAMAGSYAGARSIDGEATERQRHAAAR